MKIVDIHKIQNDSQLYDLQTKNENYFANDILVHNSLIKLWSNSNTDSWQFSTMSTINANDAELMVKVPKETTLSPQPIKDIDTFYDLIMYTLCQMSLKKFPYSSTSNIIYEEVLKLLDKNYTFLFELATPYNRVVVPYTDSRLIYLSSLNNETGEEKIFKELLNYFPVPKEYSFSSLEECIESTKILPYSEEGYVVKDAKNNRCKVKSLAYLQVAHIKDNGGCLNVRRVVELVRIGETEEILSYFPEYKEFFDYYIKGYSKLVNRITTDWNFIHDQSIKGLIDTRKEFAQWNIKNCIYPSINFSMYDSKYDTLEKAIKDIKLDTVVYLIKKVYNE